MDFHEFKYKLKRELKLGTYTFYVVPKDLKYRHHVDDYQFPYKSSVTIAISETKKKKFLDFESGFGCDAGDGLFFFEDEFEKAQAYATKLHRKKYIKLKKQLDDFDNQTNFTKHYKIFSEKYPELYV